ncbi:cephalosporin hydroxylase family protein [Rhodophyticola porphyridii]|uniref:Cephalosporin hydroxylase n=1 Tax=Rhodophyticola porphyridii TaxID=1852017 RepID=A0A3L9Y0Q6_9RHOB|nr:CmcI family methyltransferase [Rhodophyticola porphyridii]RMA40657.1 cephalosporin hydroxylase [Rhodophyticola porphyridii]
MTDDRHEFAEFQKAKALQLGADTAVFDASKKLIIDLNEHAYAYQWTWFGVPIIQLPADVMVTQEVIWSHKPDVIIETGVARGGSVIFMASLLEAMGNGVVIGVDIDIRAHNREAIETHPMSKRIHLVEGSSVAKETLSQIRDLIPTGARVMVVLDSDHSYDHVLAECRAYGELVTEGGYLVVADTLVGHLSEEEAPKDRSKLWSRGNEPLSASKTYLSENDAFEVDPIINAKLVMSSSPGGYLRRIKA